MTDEPTYTLKASDPLAMGLLSVLACLRAHEFATAEKQFAGLMKRAQEEPRATEKSIHAAWSVAADMQVWRFRHHPSGGPTMIGVDLAEHRDRHGVAGIGHNGGPPLDGTNVIPYPGPPNRVLP